MLMNKPIKIFPLITLLIFIPLLIIAQNRMAPPNFVFILADDLGYFQLGCYGSSYHETPHIDNLASE